MERKMTFQNLQMNRVLRAVAIVSFLGIVLSGCGCYGYLIAQVMPEVDSTANMTTQQEQMQAKLEPLLREVYEDPPTDLNIIFAIQLGFLLVLALWQANWAAQQSDSPQQAVGHGLIVSLGILITYGALVLFFAPTSLWIKLGFAIGLIGVGWWGGQIAAQNLHKTKRTAPFQPATPFGSPIPGGLPPSSPLYGAPASPGMNPDIVYNMGVSAAMGGRPDEARQHFTRALQINPRFIAAWLQLANLATTPEEAWNYIQQARALNPADPAVVQAVGVIWPQVARRAKAASQTSASPDDVPPPFDPGDAPPPAV